MVGKSEIYSPSYKHRATLYFESHNCYIRPSQMATRGPNPARRPCLLGPLSTPIYIGKWWSFGPQTSIFELSSALCGPQGKIIENPCVTCYSPCVLQCAEVVKKQTNKQTTKYEVTLLRNMLQLLQNVEHLSAISYVFLKWLLNQRYHIISCCHTGHTMQRTRENSSCRNHYGIPLSSNALFSDGGQPHPPSSKHRDPLGWTDISHKAQYGHEVYILRWQVSCLLSPHIMTCLVMVCNPSTIGGALFKKWGTSMCSPKDPLFIPSWL